MKKLMATAVFLIAGMSWAFEPSQPNPQTVDGQDTTDSCGLGWSVMDSPTILGSSVRGTTNNFLPPSFSMTFGTSGCEAHEIAKNEQEAARYAVVNSDNLKNEMAEGGGEFVTALAETMGCGSDVATFSKVAQENFSAINADGIQLYKNIRAQVRKNAKLSQTCKIVG